MSFLTIREQVAPRGIGKPLRRREDARFLTGAGKYADDMKLPGQAYAYPGASNSWRWRHVVPFRRSISGANLLCPAA